MREKGIILENRANRAAVGRLICNIYTIQNYSSGIGRLKAAANAQQSGFAASVASHEDAVFPGVDFHVCPRVELFVRIGEIHGGDF